MDRTVSGESADFFGICKNNKVGKTRQNECRKTISFKTFANSPTNSIGMGGRSFVKETFETE
jgi:hypothetical protein